jgi:outer membrane protein OmpA-like peptidoglycan-associated protein
MVLRGHDAGVRVKMTGTRRKVAWMSSRLGSTLLFLFCSSVLAGAAFADCGQRSAALRDRLQTNDIRGIERIVEEIGDARECGPSDKRAARRVFAERLLTEARRLRADPAQADTAAHMIEKAAAQNVSWAAALALGDLQVGRRAYADAARSYQKAIDLIASEEDPAAAKVPRDTLTYLARRADETRHLAAAAPKGTLVVAPERDDGEFGGVFSPALDRGPEAVRVPSPILFVYNSDQFTPIGAEAAQEFATLLKQRDPASIVVTGHTDRIGSDAFNLELSKRRAEHVAVFLKTNGVTGRITTVGKGRSEPRVLSDPSSYTQEQIDELNRRVEFDWKQ